MHRKNLNWYLPTTDNGYFYVILFSWGAFIFPQIYHSKHIFTLRKKTLFLKDSIFNPHTHGQMIFDKCAKTIHMGKGQTFQRIVREKQDIHMQKNETEPLLYTVYKNLLEMDQKRNVRTKNIKSLKRMPKWKASWYWIGW